MLIFVTGLLFGSLYYKLAGYSFAQKEFISLKESASLVHNREDYLENIDQRENSIYFAFSNEREATSNKIDIIPRFTVVNKKIRSIADFIIIDKKSKVSMSVEKYNSFNFLQSLEKDYSFGNSLHFFKNEQNNEKQWAELLSILLENNPLELFKKHFGSIWSLYQFRNELFGAPGSYSYQLVQIGNRKFIIYADQLRDKLSFFPIGEKNVVRYSMKGDLVDIKQILQGYFSKVQWIFHKREIPFPLDAKDLTVFTILDYFTFKNLLPEHRHMVEVFTISYYKKLLASNKSSTSYIRKELLNSLKELHILSLLRDENDDKFYSEDFEKGILKLQEITREGESNE